ncbi:hypothetical protein KSX_95010 [Ktedonospora formicarum]|uniref:Uncharacterized protein n=1 Tax=Ktedonospora formicarum TaxID=2778364 RepID=A0A8J3ICA1_9CHLR|nr:hypothetical protein KSX_95010 [Ktedonospora formicarum]
MRFLQAAEVDERGGQPPHEHGIHDYLLAIQPRLYDILRYNVTEMGKRLQNITTYKMRRLRLAGIFSSYTRPHSLTKLRTHI